MTTENEQPKEYIIAEDQLQRWQEYCYTPHDIATEVRSSRPLANEDGFIEGIKEGRRISELGMKEHDAAIAQAVREKVLKTIRGMRSPDFGRFALKQRNATLEEVIEQLDTESAPLLNPEQEQKP